MFFLWTGNGLFIPVIAVVSFILGAITLGMLDIPSPFWEVAGVATIVALSLYRFSSSRFGRTVSHTSVKRFSRETTVEYQRHSFLLIPARGWTVLALLPALGLITLAYMVPQQAIDFVRGAKTPAEMALILAHTRIMSPQNGTAIGNTPEAALLAEKVSTRISSIRDEMMASVSQETDAINHGRFLVHCQLGPEGCAFLVNVPKLRNLNLETRDRLAEAIWRVAQEYTATLPVKPSHLAVGIRGFFLYDRVLTGPVGPGWPHSSQLPGDHARKALAVYFLQSGDTFDRVCYSAPAGGGPAVASSSLPPVYGGFVRPAPAVKHPTFASTPSLPTPIREWKAADGRSLRGNLVRFANVTGDAALFMKEDDGLLYTVELTRFAPEVQTELREIRQQAGR